MTTYPTTYPTPSLGRWLVTLAGSLLLLALAYARAPDPADSLGLELSDARSLASSQPAPHLQR